MTNKQFEELAMAMKERKLGVDDLTNLVNQSLARGLPKVHIQEMINYLIKTEPMPEEVENILIIIFELYEVKEEYQPIATNQISFGGLGVKI